MIHLQEIREERLTGERALFKGHDINIVDSIFADGESPLKESRRIKLTNSSFQWKYPLWYAKDIEVCDSAFFEMARAGIWYTEDIALTNVLYEAPKGFRRAKGIKLTKVDFTNAAETLWNCDDITMGDVSAKGDYFAMGSKNIRIKDFHLAGNYSFDGCKNVEVKNAKLLSKDAFWNAENVTVYDSYIVGEYFGWNSKNVTLVNCTVESLQGFCYMENVTLKNCRLLNTTLAFEYSTVDAEITTRIESVKNPISGKIKAQGIDEIIFDDPNIKREKTEIILAANQS